MALKILDYISKGAETPLVLAVVRAAPVMMTTWEVAESMNEID